MADLVVNIICFSCFTSLEKCRKSDYCKFIPICILNHAIPLVFNLWRHLPSTQNRKESEIHFCFNFQMTYSHNVINDSTSFARSPFCIWKTWKHTGKNMSFQPLLIGAAAFQSMLSNIQYTRKWFRFMSHCLALSQRHLIETVRSSWVFDRSSKKVAGFKMADLLPGNPFCGAVFSITPVIY